MNFQKKFENYGVRLNVIIDNLAMLLALRLRSGQAWPIELHKFVSLGLI